MRTVVPRVEGKKPSEYEKRALFKFAIHPRRGQDIETSVDATIRSREASFTVTTGGSFNFSTVGGEGKEEGLACGREMRQEVG